MGKQITIELLKWGSHVALCVSHAAILDVP